MPDLKDKYSDQELDRSHTAFDEIVNRPDMRALDDQGNAIARDLKDAEETPADSPGVDRPASSDSLSAAEAASSDAPENRFNYQKTDVSSSGGGWTRRKKLFAGGGISGGIVAAIIAGFMMLAGKIPALAQMVADEAGQRVEQITEKRAKMMVGRYIIQHAGVGIVLTGEGPVATLMASMRTNRFEDRLAAKGLEIQRSNGGVKLIMKGEELGNGQILKNEAAIVRALESNRLSNKMLKDVVKEDIPSWRWMKRAKFAKWLRIKYGIPRYGIENSDNQDEKERVKEMQKSRLKVAYDGLAATISEGVGCILTTECDVDTNGRSRPTDIKQSGDTAAITDSVSGSVEETVDANANNTDMQKTLITTVLDKLGSKAIPIIGWIDLLATADHIAYKAVDEDYFGQLAATMRAKQYAQHYGIWSGYGSQIQLGAMDPEFIGVLAKQTEGVEESQAFSYIEGEPNKGVPVEKIGANGQSSFAEQAQELKAVLAPASGLPGVAESTHFVLNLYYETIGGGGLLGWLSEKIGGFLAKLASALTPEVFEDWAGKMMAKVGDKLFEMFGLDFDPMINGPEWFNAFHGGATWTYNDFCKNEMGCRKLTPAQTAVQNSAVAADRADYRQSKGLAYQLFSPDVTTSLTTQLAIHSPSTVDSAVSKFARLVTGTPATLLGALSPKTKATAYTDIHGVDPYGALASEIDQPLDGRAISGEACNDSSDGKKLDLCRTDTMVAEAMLCEFEPESADCAEGDAALGAVGEGIEFTVGSYNILHSDSHTDKSNAIGGCNRNPVPGDPTCAKTRGALQVKIITGQEGNPAFDIFGTQETSADQYNYLKQNLPNYDAFPENTSRMNNAQDGAVAVFWNTEKFSKIDSGKAPGLSNTSKDITVPWVGLQATSGQKIYVMSIHYAISSFGGTNESIKRSSELTMDWVRSKVSDDSIAIVVGDFNDRLGQKLSYCVFTKDSLMQHAVDMEAGADPSAGCSANRDPGIDHIYATPRLNLTASNWTRMAKTGTVARASDHAPVYAKYVIPGEGGGSSFRIATFNIYHSDDPIWKERLRRSVDTLLSHKVDIAGLQEVRPDQNKLFRDSDYGGNTYDMYPTALQNPEFSPNPIVWNKAKFKLIKTGSVPFQYFGGANDKAPLVKLQDIGTGQQFYVINTHDPADARGPAAELRYKNALRYAEIFKNMAKEGLPIFFTGDFNSGYEVRRSGNDTWQYKRENLTYCILTAPPTTLWDAYDGFKKRDGQCPSTKVDFSDNYPGSLGIDHIFLSRSVTVSEFFRARAGKQYNGSDVHPTIIAGVTIPGTGGAGAAGDWSWPVKESAWKTDGQRWLEIHFAGSDAFTNDIQAGADVNIGSGNSDCDEPVYSMLGGTIVPNPPNYTMQVKSKVNGKDVIITYAHGNKMKQSGTVKSGEQIMVIGDNGNSSACHLHLEIKYGSEPICPQDIFPLLAKKQPIDLSKVPKATVRCG